jgi:hypothetical protein
VGDYSSVENVVDLNLAGEMVRVTTRASDQLNAERGIGGPAMEHAVEMAMRVWWSALRRDHPDHPATKAFGEFVYQFKGSRDVSVGTAPGDELVDLDDERRGELDPTHAGDSAD